MLRFLTHRARGGRRPQQPVHRSYSIAQLDPTATLDGGVLLGFTPDTTHLRLRPRLTHIGHTTVDGDALLDTPHAHHSHFVAPFHHQRRSPFGPSRPPQRHRRRPPIHILHGYPSSLQLHRPDSALSILCVCGLDDVVGRYGPVFNSTFRVLFLSSLIVIFNHLNLCGSVLGHRRSPGKVLQKLLQVLLVLPKHERHEAVGHLLSLFRISSRGMPWRICLISTKILSIW